MEDNRHVKILVSTVDAWNDSVGSDTIPSLLQHLDREDIASVNIRAERSDSTVASRYFHILEQRVLKSILHPGVQTGEAYFPEPISHSDAEVEKEQDFYGRRRLLNRYFYVLARELVWKLGRWKSSRLDDFVASFQPDVFFFPIESYIHFNRLNEYIVNKFHPKKVVGYMWDDNFTYRQNRYNPLYLLHRFFLKRSVSRLVGQCSSVFVISQVLKDEFEAHFNCQATVLTKPIRQKADFTFVPPHRPLQIVYTGNLLVGRDKTLLLMLERLKAQPDLCERVCVTIYNNNFLSSSIRKKIQAYAFCRLYENVPRHLIYEKQKEADVLLFLETLSSANLVARLSFSSKLTDYFSAGKCILAIGNSQLGPIKYLREENAAIVCTRPSEIAKRLEQMLGQPDLVRQYARNAYDCGRRNHDAGQMEQTFLKIISHA